jgi:hypothetical protein
MSNDDNQTGRPESAHHEPDSVREKDAGGAERPAWALTELTRSASSAARSESPRSDGRANGRGIEWVRPTDLAPRVGAAITDRAADAHRDAHAWARTRLREAATPSERKRRLPPPSSFGNNGPAPSGRDAIGL